MTQHPAVRSIASVAAFEECSDSGMHTCTHLTPLLTPNVSAEISKQNDEGHYVHHVSVSFVWPPLELEMDNTI